MLRLDSRKAKSQLQPWKHRPRDEYVTSLRRGSSLLKFGRTGAPHFTFFVVSEDESELLWKSDNVSHGKKFRSVRLGDVKSVEEGQKTQTFSREARTHLAHLSFSLIYTKRDKERTLDITCKTEQEYELWLHGLRAFIAFQKETNCRLLGSQDRDEAKLRDSVSSCLTPITSGSSPLASSEVGARHCISDLFVWGGCEADLSSPVDGWQQSALPTLVNDSARLDVRQVSISAAHAVLVTAHGHVYTWGRGTGGKLGHGSAQDFSQPKLVEELWESEHVKQVDCSENISLAVTRGGAVYSWGDGKKIWGFGTWNGH